MQDKFDERLLATKKRSAAWWLIRWTFIIGIGITITRMNERGAGNARVTPPKGRTSEPQKPEDANAANGTEADILLAASRIADIRKRSLFSAVTLGLLGFVIASGLLGLSGGVAEALKHPGKFKFSDVNVPFNGSDTAAIIIGILGFVAAINIAQAVMPQTIPGESGQDREERRAAVLAWGSSMATLAQAAAVGGFSLSLMSWFTTVGVWGSFLLYLFISIISLGVAGSVQIWIDEKLTNALSLSARKTRNEAAAAEITRLKAVYSLGESTKMKHPVRRSLFVAFLVSLPATVLSAYLIWNRLQGVGVNASLRIVLTGYATIVGTTVAELLGLSWVIAGFGRVVGYRSNVVLMRIAMCVMAAFGLWIGVAVFKAHIPWLDKALALILIVALPGVPAGLIQFAKYLPRRWSPGRIVFEAIRSDLGKVKDGMA